MKAHEQFLQDHPFRFNLLRLLDGELMHVNSLFRDYNCADADLQEADTNFARRVICRTQEEIDAAILTPLRGRQKLYILTPLKRTKRWNREEYPEPKTGQQELIFEV